MMVCTSRDRKGGRVPTPSSIVESGSSKMPFRTEVCKWGAWSGSVGENSIFKSLQLELACPPPTEECVRGTGPVSPRHSQRPAGRGGSAEEVRANARAPAPPARSCDAVRPARMKPDDTPSH